MLSTSTTSPIAAAPSRAAAAPALHYETADHVLCDASTPGARPFVKGGLQPDGRCLAKLDLDSHSANQDAEEIRARLEKHLPTLYAKLSIRPTKRGGHHIPFYYHRPLAEVKLYDARQPGRHIGELCTLTMLDYLMGRI